MDVSLSKLQEMVKDREACMLYSPWGCKESDTTEWLNNNNNVQRKISKIINWPLMQWHILQTSLCNTNSNSFLACLSMWSWAGKMDSPFPRLLTGWAAACSSDGSRVERTLTGCRLRDRRVPSLVLWLYYSLRFLIPFHKCLSARLTSDQDHIPEKRILDLALDLTNWNQN